MLSVCLSVCHFAPPKSRWRRGMELEWAGRIKRNTGGRLSQGSLVGSCPQIAASPCSSTTAAVATPRCRGSWRRRRWRGSSGWNLKFDLGLATGGRQRQCGLPASLLYLVEGFQLIPHFYSDSESNQKCRSTDSEVLSFYWSQPIQYWPNFNTSISLNSSPHFHRIASSNLKNVWKIPFQMKF